MMATRLPRLSESDGGQVADGWTRIISAVFRHSELGSKVFKFTNNYVICVYRQNLRPICLDF